MARIIIVHHNHREMHRPKGSVMWHHFYSAFDRFVRRFVFSCDRNQSRIAASISGVVAWLIAAMAAAAQQLKTLGGFFVTAVGLLTALGTFHLLRGERAPVTGTSTVSSTIQPTDLDAPVLYITLNALFPNWRQNYYLALLSILAVLPLFIGVSVWLVAFGAVKLLTLVFSWKPAAYDISHVAICFVVSWIVLTGAVILACKRFTPEKVLKPLYWRPVDYPWIMTATATITFSVLDFRSTHPEHGYSPVQTIASELLTSAERWNWLLILAVLLAFRLTRTTAEWLNEFRQAFRAALDPREATAAVENWLFDKAPSWLRKGLEQSSGRDGVG